jgi:N-acetylneuraminic acid mutarotase
VDFSLFLCGIGKIKLHQQEITKTAEQSDIKEKEGITMKTLIILVSVLSICPIIVHPIIDLYAFSNKMENEEWTLLPMTNPPPPRYCHVQVFDSKRNKIIIFGGWHYDSFHNTYTMYDDTWQGDLTTYSWQIIETATHPSSRGCYAILDSCNDRILLFGGFAYLSNEFIYYTDLWQFNLETLIWEQLNPNGPSPENNGDFLVYDSRQNRMLLFGGGSINPPYPALNETWALSLDSLLWQKLNTTGALPRARWGHGAVYDVSKNRMIVFGGKYEENSNTYFLKDLWELNLGTLEWNEIVTPPTLIQARAAMAMIMDTPNKRLLVFGGECKNFDSLNDVWEFKFETQKWKRLAPIGAIPEKRSWIIGEYDHVKARMLVFGGNDAFTEMLNDLYELNLPIQDTEIKITNNTIMQFGLEQNYPNPFNASTTIDFVIPKSGYTELKVYDIKGGKVATLVNGQLQKGAYKMPFNGTHLPSGIYLYRLKTNKFTMCKKMLLAK